MRSPRAISVRVVTEFSVMPILMARKKKRKNTNKPPDKVHIYACLKKSAGTRSRPCTIVANLSEYWAYHAKWKTPGMDEVARLIAKTYNVATEVISLSRVYIYVDGPLSGELEEFLHDDYHFGFSKIKRHFIHDGPHPDEIIEAVEASSFK